MTITFRKIGILIFSLTIISCATQSGIDKSNLQKSQKLGYLQVNRDIQWKSEWKLGSNVNYWQLSAGKFTPLFDSKTGTYYQGEGNCFSLKVRSEKEKIENSPLDRDWSCGIFVPNNTSLAFKVYYTEDTESCISEVNSYNSGVLVSALARSECDNIKHAYSQPEEGIIESGVEFIEKN